MVSTSSGSLIHFRTSLFRCLTGFLVYLPVCRLTVLATVEGLLALSTLPQLLAFGELILSFVASCQFAEWSIETVRGSVVLVVDQNNLKLALHRSTEARIEERQSIFGRNANLGVIGAKKIHVFGVYRCSNTHSKSGY
jgi:Zn-dependent protease with chaperone function